LYIFSAQNPFGMSKRRPAKKKGSKSTVSKKSSSTSGNGGISLERPSISSSQDPFLKKVFWGMAGVLGILLLLFSLGSGLNGDDEYQNDYSEKLLAYYATGGEDASALNIPKGNMHYYGGFFDILTGVANQALGYEVNDPAYHDVRHLFNGLFGWLLMLLTALLVKEIAGWRSAILAFLFMYLSPRLLGHSFMNPKDIPFAAGYVMALLFMVRWLARMPKFHYPSMAGVIAGIALAVATRAGGLLLVPYLVLFAGLDFLFKYGFKGLTSKTALVGRYALGGVAMIVGGYILAILFWPYALDNPLSHPFKALTEFSQLGVKIRVLFEGENVMSDNTPWYYALKWIFMTIPIYVLLGVGAGIALLLPLWKRYQPLPLFIAVFAFVFPLAYIIYKDSILHDGWRHLIFVYPGMIVLATLAWTWLEERFKDRKPVRYAIWGVLVLLMLEPTVFIARNIHYPYVYFNPLIGGVQGAYGEYEMDYWGVSVKQAIDWMEEEGIISEDMEETIRVASSFSYNIQKYLSKKYNGKVKTNYVKYSQRYDKEWDYAIFPSRYVRGPHLREGIWPSSKAVHIVEANGVPLTAVLKAEEKYAFEGQQALMSKDWAKATQAFLQEVEKYPDNELAWLGLANAAVNTQQYPQAISYAEKALGVVPDNVQALYFKGVSQLNSGQLPQAQSTFQEAISVNEDYVAAYYYLALIQQQQGQNQQALGNLQKAIQVNPRFKAAYDLAARIHESMGNTNQAQQIRSQAQQIQ
jgi:tetratricopeptide (TPR) repeat protein